MIPRCLFFLVMIGVFITIPCNAQTRSPSTSLVRYSVKFHTTTNTLVVKVTRSKSGFVVEQHWDNGLLITETLPYKDIIGIDPPTLNSTSGVWEAGLWLVQVRGRPDAHFTEARSDMSSAPPRQTTNVFLIPCNTRDEAQTVYDKLTQSWKTFRYVVQCPDAGSSIACDSFNAMVEKHDADIMNVVDSPFQYAYVCFNSDYEDRFLTLSVGLPPSSGGWRKTGPSGELVYSPTLLDFEIYTKGVLEDSRIAFLKWSKVTGVAGSETATTVPHVTTQRSNASWALVDINQEELDLQYKFTNLDHTVTSYLLQIRRSTNRFLETYNFPNRNGQTGRTTNEGSCVEFGGQSR